MATRNAARSSLATRCGELAPSCAAVFLGFIDASTGPSRTGTSAPSALAQSAGRRAGPVVAAITGCADLPLALVAAAQAKRRETALVLVHVTGRRPKWTLAVGAGCPPAPHTGGATGGRDSAAALRDRALTLAQLSHVDVTWAYAIGRPNRVLARYCRDNSAALIVIGASRRQLTAWRRRKVLSAARRLKRRAHTPIHIITT